MTNLFLWIFFKASYIILRINNKKLTYKCESMYRIFLQKKISAKCHENIKMIIKKITVEKYEINGRY